jgi:hypothetical protein
MFIFLGSINNPSSQAMCPNNIPKLTQNAHFWGLRFMPLLQR